MGIWGQIYPVCWRLWSSARDDFDPVCLAKWNQYVNIRHPATSDVLPIKPHHSRWLEFPKCPSHRCDRGGYFKNALILATFMFKQWTTNWYFHQWGLKPGSCWCKQACISPGHRRPRAIWSILTKRCRTESWFCIQVMQSMFHLKRWFVVFWLVVFFFFLKSGVRMTCRNYRIIYCVCFGLLRHL